MQNIKDIPIAFLNVLLNTPDTDHRVCNEQMQHYLESLAGYIETETDTAQEAACFVRSRMADFK